MQNKETGKAAWASYTQAPGAGFWGSSHENGNELGGRNGLGAVRLQRCLGAAHPWFGARTSGSPGGPCFEFCFRKFPFRQGWHPHGAWR